MAASETHQCPSCDADVDGDYCKNCGEHLLSPDFSTWHFIKQSFSFITNLDNKFYQSFKLLLAQPGYLSDAYLRGRRRPYLRPIQMFIIANLVYFFVQPLTIYNTLNNSLQSHMYRQVYSSELRIADKVNAEVEARGIPFEQFEALYNQQSTTYAKSFVFLLVPVFALLLYAVFGRTRKHYLEHFVFSFHFTAFNLFFILSIYLYFFGWFFSWFRSTFLSDYYLNGPLGSTFLAMAVHYVSEMSAQIPVLIYLYIATKRFYKQSSLVCLLKCIFLTWASLYMLYFYRIVLFWLTFYSI